MFNVAWFVNSNQTLDPIHHNTTLFNEAYAEWNRTHTGLFATQGGPTHIAWLRLDPKSLASNNFTDPSAGPNSPHFQVIFVVSHFQRRLVKALIMDETSSRVVFRPLGMVLLLE
jgi:hypothetical protein